jgi:nuclear RNA export factor
LPTRLTMGWSHREIATRFPTLSALDGQALQPTKAPQPVASTSKTPLGSGLKQAASFPVGVQPGFSDDSKALVAAFLIKCVVPGDLASSLRIPGKSHRYFTLFDSNRALLYAAYSPQATFSVSVNSAIPFRAKASKAVQDLPRQHKLNWQPYFDQSRNMLKTHKIDEAQLQGSSELSLLLSAQGRSRGQKTSKRDCTLLQPTLSTPFLSYQPPSTRSRKPTSL